MGPTEVVELVWDWRLARVYDAQCNIIDECVWEGTRSIAATVKRLKNLKLGRMTDEARVLHERFPEANQVHSISFQNWPLLDTNEAELLQKSSLVLAEQEILEVSSAPDFRLEHLVRALDVSRSTANNVESQLADWITMLLPSIDVDQHRSSLAATILDSDDWDQFTSRFQQANVAAVESGEWDSIRALAKQIGNANSAVITMENSLQELANSYLPSLSILLGPAIAAQLCVAAHGRDRLARLPASTIQVLGAEKSFFSHLNKGTKPPKHGYIFQHTWISRSPKSTRGSIARMLSSKAAIAARVDCFGGSPWGAKERSEVEKKVGAIRARKKWR